MEESEARQEGKEGTRKATFGSKQGLQVIVDQHSNLDSVGTLFGNDNSFKVHIGQPTSFPMLTYDRLTLPTGKDTKSYYICCDFHCRWSTYGSPFSSEFGQ